MGVLISFETGKEIKPDEPLPEPILGACEWNFGQSGKVKLTLPTSTPSVRVKDAVWAMFLVVSELMAQVNYQSDFPVDDQK